VALELRADLELTGNAALRNDAHHLTAEGLDLALGSVAVTVDAQRAGRHAPAGFDAERGDPVVEAVELVDDLEPESAGRRARSATAVARCAFMGSSGESNSHAGDLTRPMSP
jgi:hypothetical protein